MNQICQVCFEWVSKFIYFLALLKYCLEVGIYIKKCAIVYGDKLSDNKIAPLTHILQFYATQKLHPKHLWHRVFYYKLTAAVFVDLNGFFGFCKNFTEATGGLLHTQSQTCTIAALCWIGEVFLLWYSYPQRA